jgi:hypothetical protein
MESTAKQDLVERLGGPRRPVPPDSTAGVSLSGLVTPNVTRAATPISILRSQYPKYDQNKKQVTDIALDKEIAQLSMPHGIVETPDVGSSYEETGQVANIVEEQDSDVSISRVSSMVFHFTRADYPTKQDIVCMETIICPLTNRPSWEKLVGILEQEGDFELGFKEGQDFIMINDKIRVTNERQFLASLQYLHNLKIWNSEVLVDSFDNIRKKKALSRSCSLEPNKKRKEPC